MSLQSLTASLPVQAH